MTGFSILTIKLLFLFLPGIIFSLVYERITFHTKKEFNYFIIHSFIFGVLSYYIYGLYIKLFHNCLKTKELYFLKDLLKSNDNSLHIKEIFIASLIGLFLAIIFAWFKNQHVFENIIKGEFYKQFYEITKKPIICPFSFEKCKKFKIPFITIKLNTILKFLNPFKICENDVWNNLFNNRDDDMKWVSVSDNAQKLRYEGWVAKYSYSYKENELFLRDVIVYNEDDDEIKRVPAIYLTRKSDNITIEFIAITPTELIDRYKGDEDE